MQIDEKFNEIYIRTYHKILKYVISKCDNLSSVEDIMQEVYVKYYKKLKKDDSYIENEEAYLIKIARNEIFKYYSLNNKIKIILNIKIDDKTELLDNFKDENIKIEKDLEEKYNKEQLWKMIKKQKVITQKIITLYYLEDMKLKEIAEILNLNESTVKSILYRSINKIKKELERGEEDE